MASFNLLNQNAATSVPQVTSLSSSGLNTSAFSSPGNLQNFPFSSSITPGNSQFGTSTTLSGTSSFKSTFGSPNTSLFGAAPNVTVSQSSIPFGNNAFGSLTSATGPDQNKPAFGSLNFSPNVTTTQTGLSFGMPNASTQAGISFGTSSTTSQSKTVFGVPPQTTQSGISSNITFPDTPSTSLNTSVLASTTSGLNLPFGSISTTQPVSFGGTNTTQPVSFGGTNTTQPLSSGSANTVQPLTFGDTSRTQPLTLGGTTTTQPLSFGATSTTQPLSFGTGVKSVDSTASSTSQSSSANLPVSVSTASSLFSGLNTSIASCAPSSTTSSIFGNPSITTTSTTATSGIFSWQKSGLETSSASGSTSIGLGGVDHTAVTTAESSTNTTVSVEEQPLPNEIQQTVIAFKEYVKTQKNLSSEVARSSSEPLSKLTQQIVSLKNLILTLGSVQSQQKFTAEKIKIETIKSLNDYELAQKIKDSPVASEERMLSIRKYFAEKISAFEENTKILQEKIEYVYQHVITLPQENSLSAEALKLIVKKLHDSFVVIGARAYKLHNDMQLLKVQYLTLRNQYIKDNSSISFSLNRELQLPVEASRSKTARDFTLEGPNPFSRTGNGSFNSLLLTSQDRNLPATTSTSKDWGMTGLSNISKPFGFTDLSNPSVFDQSIPSVALSSNQQFNLQKPPLGNKRGKR